jgi:subtilisin family serine protease
MLGLFVSANSNSNGYIVKVSKNRTSIAQLFSLTANEIVNGSNIYLAKNEYELNALKMFHDVEYIEPNYEVELFGMPTDPIYPEQWNLQMVNASSAWDLGCYGNEIKVGVIDSGLNNHIDIVGNKLEGHNFLNNTTDVTDNIGHGTFVSGIVASEQNNFGIVGAAYKTKIIPLKCFEKNTSTYVDTIISAINEATNVYNCDIINMSFGLSNDSILLRNAIDNAVIKGVICVAAVGNDGNSTKYYPASYDNVIGVGSVDANESVSYFSQRNAGVFMVAPGNMVTSLGNDNTYISKKGTSFSTPLVTGIIADAKNIDKSIDTDSVKRLLQITSKDLGDIGYDFSYGYGLLDAAKLFSKLLENKDFFVSPIDFEGDIASNVIYNNTLGQKTVESIFVSHNLHRIINIKNNSITIEPKTSKVVQYNNNFTKLKHFLWNDFESQIPLSFTRELVK